MLSKNDLSWLEGRKVLCPRCDLYRAHIEGTGTCHRGDKGKWMQAECRWFQRADLVPDYKDAAEFEARCAKRAEAAIFRCWHLVFDGGKGVCEVCRQMKLGTAASPDDCARSDAECRQMWCRILTEMEMEVPA